MERLIDDYYRLFDPKVFERGQAYYDAGRVDFPEEISAGLWHAVVRGTEDYQVDVRLRHGRVVSAACTCPYGQRVSYCKHVAGVLIAMEERSRREREDTDAFPREASFCVDWYLRKEFPTRKKLKEMDWRTVRILLERLYRPQDLDGMLVHIELELLSMRSESDGSASDRARSAEERHREWMEYRKSAHKPRAKTLYEERDDSLRGKGGGRRQSADTMANMRLLVPLAMPTRLNELPHTWLTVLEAAYEHLHDENGLRRLYVFYILIAQTDPEAVYVDRLRRVSGRHWAEDRDLIVRMHERRDRMLMWPSVNPAYERLLREERLSESAFRYAGVGGKSADMTVRLLDVIAKDPECARKAKERLLTVLRDPDSFLYESDTVESAGHVGAWIRRIETVYGFGSACDISMEIIGMFPRRKALRSELAEYLTERREPRDGAAQMSRNDGMASGR
ncbi:SWIM zinc finger family protein [Bifidobacterium aesculapii]|uniref:SWIM zinc finger family protein n=1 Tax=Bifidobacterium aesculapii TaxID=1329411 RepID=UPI0009E794A9|nr:SWIM zinc finger family protein [Bifidobacterium aesculapii]